MLEQTRKTLLDIYRAALARVDGASVVQQALTNDGRNGPVHLIAVGKAAAAMTQGALAMLGDAVVDGLVVTKHGHLGDLDDPRLKLIEADHPVPGEASLAAGQALIDYFSRLPADDRLVVLISGGASALVEQLPAGMTLAEWQEMTQALLASGLDIQAVNTIRRRLSPIKGGKLLGYGSIRDIEVLLISDVYGDDPAMIGSGLFHPRNDTADFEWPASLQKYRRYLDDADIGLEHRPVPPHRVVATLDDAKAAAAEAAQAAGIEAYLHEQFLDGDAERVAASLSMHLVGLPAGIHIWGGETTVELPPEPGRGGRNQHLALAMARLLAGNGQIAVLAAGTDGSDGPTDDAGALIDGGTVERGEQAGLDVEVALETFDSGRFLEASGDLVTTGPTGTNVMDLVIAAKLE